MWKGLADHDHPCHAKAAGPVGPGGQDHQGTSHDRTGTALAGGGFRRTGFRRAVIPFGEPGALLAAEAHRRSF